MFGVFQYWFINIQQCHTLFQCWILERMIIPATVMYINFRSGLRQIHRNFIQPIQTKLYPYVQSTTTNISIEHFFHQSGDYWEISGFDDRGQPCTVVQLTEPSSLSDIMGRIRFMRISPVFCSVTIIQSGVETDWTIAPRYYCYAVFESPPNTILFETRLFTPAFVYNNTNCSENYKIELMDEHIQTVVIDKRNYMLISSVDNTTKKSTIPYHII